MSDGTIQITQRSTVPSGVAGTSILWFDTSGNLHTTNPSGSDAILNHAVVQGRLTLESGVPISTSDQADKTTLYYTPINGNRVAVHNGTVWECFALTEKSLDLSANTPPRTQAYTNDPASGENIELAMTNTAGFLVGDYVKVSSSAGTEISGSITVVHDNTHITVASLALNHTTTSPLITGGLPYDIWLYSNAGTLTLEGTAWTNRTTRATALTTQDGVYVKTGAITRRYLGTIYIDTSGKCQDTIGKRFCWNYYNRVPRRMQVTEATDSWIYTTATWRSANNSTANRVECVVGVAEMPTTLMVNVRSHNSSASWRRGGIGLDVTNANNCQVYQANDAAAHMFQTVYYRDILAVGYHYLQWTEYSQATGTCSWYGDDGASGNAQSGMIGEVIG